MPLTSSGEEKPYQQEATRKSSNTQEFVTEAEDAGDPEGDHDGNEEWDDEEDDEDGSELSDGDDLRDDLERVFSRDWNYQGSFYHAEAYSFAPNPCLSIKGVGQIGLPLSERDARLLIRGASHTSFSRRAELSVDHIARTTWEIEAERLQFLNPGWAKFVQDTVVNSVLNALGVAPAVSQIECEPYKLLLYETGTRLLPHQDTGESLGKFATVVIILPSLFSGGEVLVSHRSKKRAINLAPHSLSATSVIAWFTDVFHEVKTITSGYRLALSYNLTHTEPGVPRPRAPEGSSALDRARTIFRKWRDELYREMPSDDRIAYVLEHQYSPSDLLNGLKALNGKDAQLSSCIKRAVEGLGLCVYLGSLRYTESRPTDDDCGYGHHKRSRGYDLDQGDATNIYLNKVEYASIVVNNIVDGEGDVIHGASLQLFQDSLIPKHPFEDVNPDGKSYQGCQGGNLGKLDQWYLRSVLVITTEYSTLDPERTMGVLYHLAKLQNRANLKEPTPENRKAAYRVVRSLSRTTHDVGLGAIKYMINLATQWKDRSMWNDLINIASSTKAKLGLQELVHSMPAFGFDTVRPHLETTLRRHARLQSKLDIINQLSEIAAAGTYPGMDTWSRELYTSSMTSLESLTLADIPALLGIARERGASYLYKKLLPLIAQRPDFDFAIAIMNSLHEHRRQYIDARVVSDDERSLFDQLLVTCLDVCLMQCSTTTAHPGHVMYWSYEARTDPYPAKLDRVINTVKLCHTFNRHDRILMLFSLILRTEGTQPLKITQFYAPLVSRLHTFTAQANISLFSSPYKLLVKIIIELYLHYVLATPTMTIDMHARQIGCWCSDCSAVNQFLRDTHSTQRLFRMIKPRRLHVEDELNNIRDIVGYETIRSGSPYGVNIKKTPAFMASQLWKYRAQTTKQFLLSIGSITELAELMGRRYDDIVPALRGTCLYTLDQAHYIAFSSLTSGRLPSSIGPSNSNVILNPANIVAGRKRKMSTPPVIIDLTSGD